MENRVLSEFILRMVGQAFHGWLFRETHFIGSL